MHQNIHISSTTRGTPQDTYEQNDLLIKSPIHPVVEVQQLSIANIYTLDLSKHIYTCVHEYECI